MKNHIYALLLVALALSAIADVAKPISAPSTIAFSTMSPGQPLPKQFRVVTLPKIKSNQFSLVADDGKTVLRVDSDSSAGSLALALTSVTGRTLAWRWKVSRMLDKADMETKSGDDFSARVYVFFDVPLESLPFLERTGIRLARAVAGAEVPTAALCYVWDNTHRIGHTQWSPYTNRVRMLVLQSGPANVNSWMTESRDVAADFREAFGVDAPAVTGVAIGNDTDNTGEKVVTWYGDVSLTNAQAR